jgi:hypothetical protein
MDDRKGDKQPMVTVARAAAPRAPQPPELHATEAAKGTILEDWIFSVERLIRSQGAVAFEDRIELAGLYWDRQVNTWWTGAQELAWERGQPILDWAGFLAALRANYTPISDVDTACTMLFQLTMRAGESMDHYVARAHELFNRIPRARVPTEMAAEFLQRGVDPRRFPLALAAAALEQQQERARSEGRGMTFDALRGRLVEAAAREPTHLLAGASSSAAAGGQRGLGASRQRINNIGMSRYEHPEEQDDEEARRHDARNQLVNAVNVADIRCYRCQGRGHMARECSRPETRQCRQCHKKGHLSHHCPNADGGGSSGSGKGAENNEQASTQPPKNV